VWASRAAAGSTRPASGIKQRVRPGAQQAASGTRDFATATSASAALVGVMPSTTQQLLSSGTSQLSCIQATASKAAATSLVSRDGKYVLSLSFKDGLQLANTKSQALVWTPAQLPGATNSKVKASRFCLATNGTLLLVGSKPGVVLWQSTPPTSLAGSIAGWQVAAPARSSKSYAAYISSQGQLTVVDSQCAKVYPAQSVTRRPLPSPRARARPPQPAAVQQTTRQADRPPRLSAFRVRLPPPPSPSPSAPPPAPPEGARLVKLKSSLSQLELRKGQAPGLSTPLHVAGPVAGSGSSSSSSSSTSNAESGFGGFGSAPVTRAACLPGAKSAALVGSLCGGSNLCGLDIPCTSLVCCTSGLTCRRRNAFTWMCLKEELPKLGPEV
jgi:hypothetical protein